MERPVTQQGMEADMEKFVDGEAHVWVAHILPPKREKKFMCLEQGKK